MIEVALEAKQHFVRAILAHGRSVSVGSQELSFIHFVCGESCIVYFQVPQETVV